MFIYLSFFSPREIVTCETLYITSKANKIKTHYELYQELHRRVHTSCYFKTHTSQTEQIKLSPEAGTRMKCLKTAAAFMFRETIVYHLKSINYLYPLLYMNSGLVVYCMRCKTKTKIKKLYLRADFREHINMNIALHRTELNCKLV